MSIVEICGDSVCCRRGVWRTQPVNLIKFIVVTGTGFVMLYSLLWCFNNIIGTAIQ